MTAPTFPPPPPLGTWIARCMDEDRSEAIKAVRAGCKQRAKETAQTLKTMRAAMGIRREPDPVKRLAGFLHKPMTIAERQQAIDPTTGMQIDPKGIFSWQYHRAFFPRSYEAAWADYQDLRARAAKGEFRESTI